jgi:hypothetical protein
VHSYCSAGRCSVLVKVTPDLSDLLVGHTTWWTYTAMSRIYKHYSLALQGRQYKAHTSSMSSYPGMITSMVRTQHAGAHSRGPRAACWLCRLIQL